MTTLAMTEKRPWYREPFVWLIIALPSSAILAGFYTLYLAIVSYDGLVADDYYKQGLAINKRLEKEDIAKQYGLKAQVQVEQTKLRVLMNTTTDYVLPETIKVLLSHGTRQGYDQTITLMQTELATYSGSIEKLIPGHWNVIMEQDDWRVTQSLYLR